MIPLADVFIRNLDFAYGAKPVLKGFCADIASTGVTCFMGPSGCGKTALLHLLLGLETPQGGVITGMAGRRVGAVFQEDRLLDWYTALGNVLLVLTGGAAGESKACTLLGQLGLGDALGQKPPKLSGGQRRRVAIARALAVEPDMLLLDEPFNGLDENTRKGVMDLIKDYSATKPVVLVTHDEEEARYLEAKVYRMMQIVSD